jgi:indole-3-glycerol phosphate synthase
VLSGVCPIARPIARRACPTRLRMLDEAVVAKNLEVIAAGKSAAKAATKVFKALKKSSGAIAAACEYKRISTDTALLSTEDAVDFRQMGMKVRRSKAAALLIDCSSAAGKADCEEAVKEQLTAKGGFPGPVPVVRSGSVTSVNHIAEAKALGVDAVLLSMSEPNAQDMLKACEVLAMEAIVEVASKEEIERAVAAKANMLACPISLRDSIPKEIAAVALLDSRLEDPALIFNVKDSEADEAPAPQVSPLLPDHPRPPARTWPASDIMRA